MDFLVALEEKSFAITSDFFSAEESMQLFQLTQKLQKEERLKKATVGKGKTLSSRGDSIFWLEESSALPFVFSRLKEAMGFLNRRFFFNLKNLEFHLAHYASGSAYEKHVDVFQKDSSRTISMVHYLNPHWKEEAGGKLKLYLDKDQTYLVSPIFGATIFFLSTLPHEVLTTWQDRYSLTGWFKT